ncbi:ABC transporter ATP-binding protein [Arthrobacter cupressi]|uniref:Fatty acid ABC transporter ATP-binding/permease protein n=1 Tax=Arthrobacter cupressi TaxID=1045773 RepID=A0A1G8TDB4_9MICC|nr:ABC transporter ATP-binding protein [Arthrobacter cupressi]NYD79776.1 ATP-binding cassette subfamily B protein [Arthrobacter cupressi]SDJ39508.1 ATP-binding cassette, subfamily B [Arthrobacter cupressi]
MTRLPAAGSGPPERRRRGRHLLRLLKMLDPSGAAMTGALMCIAVFVVLNVSAPKILGDATDVVAEAVLGGSFNAVRFTSLLVPVTAMYLVASLLSWAQGRLTAAAVQGLAYRLREAVEDKLHRVPVAYYDGRSRGDVLSRASNDLDNVAQLLNQLLGQLITSLLMVFASLCMMLLISPLLALVALLSVPVSALLSYAVSGRAQGYFARQWAATGDVNSLVEETASGHETIKLFGARALMADRFATHNRSLYTASAQAQFLSGLVPPLMAFVANISYVLVALVGGLQFLAGAMTIGGIQAFIQFNRLFSQPLGQIGGMVQALQSCSASAARIFELLDAAELSAEPASVPDAASVNGRRGAVAFEHVSFRYRPDTPVLEDLSFRVDPGQTVAIVGHTGAGKTTVVNLLMRFHEPDAGLITVDGVDIAQLPRDTLRQHFGVVLQEPWIFTGTIRENIAYGDPSASDADIVSAAEASHVDHFVRSLPDGYATMLSNGGEPLSQGQRQLLSIARARLSGRPVLVLDEATSWVDTRTEVLIRHAMHRLRSNRTSFVIAHRLSTIRDADLILVMDHGRIVEHGTHQTLLALGGHYARLHEAQFAGSDEPEVPHDDAGTGVAQ